MEKKKACKKKRAKTYHIRAQKRITTATTSNADCDRVCSRLECPCGDRASIHIAPAPVRAPGDAAAIDRGGRCGCSTAIAVHRHQGSSTGKRQGGSGAKVRRHTDGAGEGECQSLGPVGFEQGHWKLGGGGASMKVSH